MLNVIFGIALKDENLFLCSPNSLKLLQLIQLGDEQRAYTVWHPVRNVLLHSTTHQTLA